MKILMCITYYLPHTSGLTVYAQTLAQELVKRGHQVTILTYQHEPNLPLWEQKDGITIERVSPVLSATRGVYSPVFMIRAAMLLAQHDVCHLHHPMLELGKIAGLARLFRKKAFITYHCDLRLPNGTMNKIAEFITNVSFRIGAIAANKIIAYSNDFIEHSEFLPTFKDKTIAIYPPIAQLPPADEKISNELIQQHNLQDTVVIGYVGRVSEEKGSDILVQAVPFLKEKFPRFKIVIVGEYQKVRGETFYEDNKELFERYPEHVSMHGLMPLANINSFYKICNILVVPSRRETFAMVQVEAMLQGVLVVATNIYGAREPIQQTGMGLLCEPQNPKAVAESISTVWQNKSMYSIPREKIANIFGLSSTVTQYEQLFQGNTHGTHP